MLLVGVVQAADNEVYIDQSGATSNIDIEQLGSSNIIGGQAAVAGSMTPLDLDGTGMTLDINQIGNLNKFFQDIHLLNLKEGIEYLQIKVLMIVLKPNQKQLLL